MLLSHFIPCPSPAVSTSPFSMSTSLFLSCKLVRQYCFPRFHIYALIYDIWASQVALVVKNLSASAGDVRDAGSIPEWGRSPGERNGNPLQYSCLENSMDGGSWQATVHGIAKSQTQLKRLSNSSSSHSFNSLTTLRGTHYDSSPHFKSSN